MKEEKPNSGAVSSTILELYKLHVEMADRVSQRRAVANNWFITINASIFSLGSYIGIKENLCEVVALLCFLGLYLALIWRALIGSYKKLNSAKFKVINAIEKKHLPIKPYSDEYKHYKEDKRKDFTTVEKWIPTALIIIYSLAFIYFAFYFAFGC